MMESWVVMVTAEGVVNQVLRVSVVTTETR